MTRKGMPTPHEVKVERLSEIEQHQRRIEASDKLLERLIEHHGDNPPDATSAYAMSIIRSGRMPIPVNQEHQYG